jgi:hypothetical protein
MLCLYCSGDGHPDEQYLVRDAVMTKKHFVAMAAEFRILLDSMQDAEARAAVVLTIEAFMRVAASINDRFDRDRFRSACGL